LEGSVTGDVLGAGREDAGGEKILHRDRVGASAGH
jgi:hypothetical protein